MFSPQPPSRDRQVFRSAGAAAAWWGWLVFAVASLVALAVDGRDHSAVVAAVLVIAVTGVMYGCAWCPRIVADENGISVLNPLRGHAVPWVAVIKVDLVNAVRVHAAPAPGAGRGKVIYSWAVQSSTRARLKSESRARRQSRSGAARPAAGAPGYGRLPIQAQEALEQSPAEFVAQQLAERAARERERAVSVQAGAADAGESLAAAQSVSPPGIGEVRVSWAWAPIAAMLLPVLALIIVVIT